MKNTGALGLGLVTLPSLFNKPTGEGSGNKKEDRLRRWPPG